MTNKNITQFDAILYAQNRANREQKTMAVYVKENEPLNIWSVRATDEASPEGAELYITIEPERERRLAWLKEKAQQEDGCCITVPLKTEQKDCQALSKKFPLKTGWSWKRDVPEILTIAVLAATLWVILEMIGL